MVCCLLGHKDTPSSIIPELEARIRYAIEHETVDCFLVGNNGSFDSLALCALRKVMYDYPGINYHVVLAYLPISRNEDWPYSPAETVYPEGLENVHPKYAIAWRNRWMIASADILICYITHGWGGAARYAGQARKKGKKIINLGNYNI